MTVNMTTTKPSPLLLLVVAVFGSLLPRATTAWNLSPVVLDRSCRFSHQQAVTGKDNDHDDDFSNNNNNIALSSRRGFFATAAASTTASVVVFASTAHAEEAAAAGGEEAVVEATPTPTPTAVADVISDDDIRATVLADIVERQFLATGNLTPRIYRSTATFTDEIDTYGLEQWMKGTQKLFVGEQSHVTLVDNAIDVTPEAVRFRFDEYLTFRIPLRPTVALTGTVVLTRDPQGYITSYREQWDQDVATVLKSAQLHWPF